MTALTAASAADELLADMRSLARHNGTDDLDELRALADELTTALRRVRRRIARLAKKADPPTAAAPGPAAGIAPAPRVPTPRPGTPPVAPPAAPVLGTPGRTSTTAVVRTPRPIHDRSQKPRRTRLLTAIAILLMVVVLALTTFTSCDRIGDADRPALHSHTCCTARGSGSP